MSIKTIFRVFVNAVAKEFMPKVQEEARRLGLHQFAVVLDEKRGETRVNCRVDGGKIIPAVPGFVPQFINYGLPAMLGTAVVVAEIRNKETKKIEIRVFKPSKGDKPTLYFQKGMVFSLRERSLDVFYLGAESKEEDGNKCWYSVYKPMFERNLNLPPFVVNDQQMHEYLQGELKGKVLDSYLVAVNELTLNPVMEKKQVGHHDSQPKNGVDISGCKSKDGLPGIVVAQSEPGDEEANNSEISDKEKQDMADSELAMRGKGKKGTTTTKKKTGGSPRPKTDTKIKSNRQLLNDAKAGVVEQAAE